MNIQYVPVPAWPRLAWLACCRADEDGVMVWHGEGVETTNAWFCEAAWAGAFQEGTFDQTDIVAGTGGRVRDGKLVFVSSGSTVDRLQFLEQDKGLWVSNSLACLLSGTEGGLDPTYGRFDLDLGTIKPDAAKRRPPS